MKIDTMQLEFLHPKLRKLLIWIEDKSAVEQTVTSLYRRNDPGVHGTLPVRGADLRARKKIVGKLIEELVNKNWIYDPNRLEINCAKLHGGVLHLHIQVHYNTIRRK